MAAKKKLSTEELRMKCEKEIACLNTELKALYYAEAQKHTPKVARAIKSRAKCLGKVERQLKKLDEKKSSSYGPAWIYTPFRRF